VQFNQHPIMRHCNFSTFLSGIYDQFYIHMQGRYV